MKLPKKGLTKAKARILKALSDPIRLEICEFLRDGEKCVCEIVPHIGLVQPLISRHLRILKECGIVSDRREGNRKLYSVIDGRIFEVVDAISPDLVNALSAQIIERTL